MVEIRTFPRTKTRSVLLPILLILLGERSTSAQCTICKDALQAPLADKILAIPGYPPLKCGTVDQTLAGLLPNDTSKECSVVQSLGSICDCPVKEGGCSLCANGHHPGFPKKELPDFLSDLFLGFTPTCEILDAYLRSISEVESICSISRSFISEYCDCRDHPIADGIAPPNDIFDKGCSLCPDGEPASYPDRNVTIGDFPFGSCGQLEEALSLLLAEDSQECSLLSQGYASLCGCKIPEGSCSLCRDGSTAPQPDKPLKMLKDEFGGLVPTCDVYESFVAGFERDSRECSVARLYGSACGCPSIEDHCVFCPGESMPEDHLDEVVEEFTLLYKGFAATCRDAESYLQFQISSSSKECFLAQYGNFLCGCSNGVYSYFGADTQSKKIGLEWAPRISGILSIIGSLFIIGDILPSKKRRAAVYSQLVLGMSIFDLIGSIAWALSTLMIPTDGLLGSYIQGAHGNDATCKLQGFMIQLSFTAIFYNISLSAYYILVIVYNWRDRKLKTCRWWMNGAPIALGIGLAIGGLPFYKSATYACYLQNPPVEATWYPIVFFGFLPFFLAILCTTVMMIRVYREVKRHAKRATRWELPKIKRTGMFARWTVPRESDSTADNSSGQLTGSCGNQRLRSMQRKVFIQFAFYLCAFYISWTFLVTATLVGSPALREDRSLEHLYPFYFASLVFVPLQGFFNAAIYFRPRLLHQWSSSRRRKRASETEGAGPSPSAWGGPKISGPVLASAWSSSVASDGGDTAVGDGTIRKHRDDSFSIDPSNAIAFMEDGARESRASNSERGALARQEGPGDQGMGGEKLAAADRADQNESWNDDQ